MIQWKKKTEIRNSDIEDPEKFLQSFLVFANEGSPIASEKYIIQDFLQLFRNVIEKY